MMKKIGDKAVKSVDHGLTAMATNYKGSSILRRDGVLGKLPWMEVGYQ